MIYVKLLEQVEPLNHIQGLNIEKEVNGNFQLSLTSFNYGNNPAYPLLQEESIVVVDNYEFRIKQLQESQFSKSITAISTFFDLNDDRKDDVFAGTKSFVDFATWLFNGTGWTFTTDIEESRYIPDFGNANIIALINTLCSTFECEYEILPNKRVYFAKQIGGNYDYQYRYKHNIKVLNKTVDTSNVKTYIEGYGADGLYVTYTSQLADNPLFGIRKADPIYDDRFTHADSLLEHIKSQLNDIPAVALELDVVELTSRNLGETIWLIYEPMNIELSTRIMKQTLGLINDQLATTKVVVGNVLPKTSQDLLVQQKIEINENKKEFRSKIEQTNDRITLEVEELGGQIAQVNVKADNIELTINNRITQEVSALNIRANGIEANVSNAQSQIASLQIQANSIQSQVTNLDKNVSTQIKQLEDEIELKVDTVDFNGNNIISKINLTSTTATIQASKINLKGAVTVLSDITDELGTIYAGNIYGVNIYSAYINISDDVRIGNNLYLGSSSSFSVSKRIVFNNYATIRGGGSSADGDGYGIEISASAIELRGYLNVVADATFEQDVEIEGDLIFNGSYQWKANSSGSRVYFKRNGIDLFYIDTNYGEIVPL